MRAKESELKPHALRRWHSKQAEPRADDLNLRRLSVGNGLAEVMSALKRHGTSRVANRLEKQTIGDISLIHLVMP